MFLQLLCYVIKAKHAKWSALLLIHVIQFQQLVQNKDKQFPNILNLFCILILNFIKHRLSLINVVVPSITRIVQFHDATLVPLENAIILALAIHVPEIWIKKVGRRHNNNRNDPKNNSATNIGDTKNRELSKAIIVLLE